MVEGTLDTPLGKVNKKTAFIIGGGVVVLGVVWYRQKQAASAVASSGASTEINPATGYVYGSPEDAAALANQGAYVTPGSVGGVGGGGGGYTPASQQPAPTTNAAWAQYVESTLVANGVITDPTQMGNALGKYLTGQALDPDMQSLVQQAIAFGGYPPVSGPNGYPPSMNTTPNPVHKATGTTYVTKNGDTVVGIAYYFGRSVQEIQHYNPGLPANVNQPLGAGITVIIPDVYRPF